MTPRRKTLLAVALISLLASTSAVSLQQDVTGPNGYGFFGNQVSVLENGNIVVTATSETVNGVENVGAIYLYGPSGQMISRLTGTSPGDISGTYVRALPSGNFVVASPDWRNGNVAKAGAVTWVNGTTGMNGAISPVNSLVGTHADDQLASHGITVLSNGNYVIASPFWNDGTSSIVGAVTWASGNVAGLIGTVSAANSLVGSTSGDLIGSVVGLPNGNYVVCSRAWTNGAAVAAGAVTWGDGSAGTSGAVSPTNSLVGSSTNDRICDEEQSVVGITPVGDSNYVVTSAGWKQGSVKMGAVTWARGDQPSTGPVSTTNSLVGSTTNAWNGTIRVTTLSDGNYVISSAYWGAGLGTKLGAVTWANGNSSTIGEISAANSITGTRESDLVGSAGAVALSNGNYVIVSPNWSSGTARAAGAATWVQGGASASGTVSALNSLVGTAVNQGGQLLVVPLTNGNFVVRSLAGEGGGSASVTWGSGITGLSGTASPARSLMVFASSVVALSNGNYVAANLGPVQDSTRIGSVTWGDGTGGTVGAVSTTNSFLLAEVGDYLEPGYFAVSAVGRGNYVVANGSRDIDGIQDAGAITWLNGTGPSTGFVSSENSLVGSKRLDRVGSYVDVLSNGDYLVSSYLYDNGTVTNAGALTMGRGNAPLVGIVDGSNSVRRTTPNAGTFYFSPDVERDHVVVGQPNANLFSIFQLDLLYSNGF
ncbi:MAG: hypothetical protein WBP11_08420 [Dokdonella sp.]